MKSKYVILASAVLISASTFAQKDELKKLKRIYSNENPSMEDFQEYQNNVGIVEKLATEESDKVYSHFYKGMLPIVQIQAMGATSTPEKIAGLLNSTSINELTKALNETLAFEKKSGKKIYSEDIAETIKSFQPKFLNVAIDLGSQKKFKEASSILYNLYELDRSDVEKLYYAASYAVNALDYDKALEYYNELNKLNYSGEKTVYWAKNLASGKEESFPTKADRDNYVSLKTHTEARDEKLPSKRGEIYKNIALIYVQKDKVEDAKKAIQDAKKANPDDSSLLLTEANLYLQTNDFATYEKLIKEVILKNPTNADLYYNLGVISYNNKKFEDAEKHYLKAIELDPKHANAYLNLSILKLAPEKVIIDKMNKLGTSAADTKKYDVLKKQREDVFKSVIPYLEKAHELEDKNLEVAKTLLNVYNALEIMDKAKVLKAKVKEIEASKKIG